VAVTAIVFDEDRQRCMEAGMTDFVAKACQARSPLRDGVAGVGAPATDAVMKLMSTLVCFGLKLSAAEGTNVCLL
jgi:CheY-like chemotaxis protein